MKMQHVRDMVKHWWYGASMDRWRDDRTERAIRYGGTATVLLSFGILLFLGYKWYGERQNQYACDELNTLVADYYKQVHQDKNEGAAEQWHELARQFEKGYTNHKRASVAPYFLLFKSEVHLELQEKTRALEELSRAVDAIGDKNIRSIFALKRALLMTDMEDQSFAEQGLEELARLSNPSVNPHHDQAAYYHGLYYWVQDDIEKVRSIWQPLIDSMQHELLHPSPWAQLAQQKLSKMPQ